MKERRFQFRQTSSYRAPDNDIEGLDVELLVKGKWEKLDLNLRSPGFLVFCYGIMVCQHTYMRVNAKERGLILQSSKGSVDITTAENWLIQKLHVQFDGVLASGESSTDDVEYIVDRMHYCPSTINLKDVPDTVIQVNFQ